VDLVGLDGAVLARLLLDAERLLGLPGGTSRVDGIERHRWPSAALGCPEPEHFYAQVVVDGWRVLVEAGGRVLDYRVDAAGRFRRCETASGAGGGPGWLDPTR
jgi:hypothetical protein